MRHSGLAVLIPLLATVLASSIAASDWPQWRGPKRDDVSTETELMTSWPVSGPRKVWIFKDAGVGYSGPAVVGERLYIMGSRQGKEQLIALNVNNGKEIWSTKFGDNLENKWGDGPRGTPTVDGDFVYALNGPGDLVCAQTADGSIVWQVKMSDFGGETPYWGYTESVLVDGAKVICTPGGEDGAIVALDKTNGKKIWQSEGVTNSAQYTSLMPATLHNQSQYIQLFQKNLVGIAANTGDLLWQSEWNGEVAVIPTPIPFQNTVYISSGYGVGCKLVRVASDGQTEDLYVNKTMKNQHGGVVLHNGYLYGYSDGVGWVCQDFETGQMIWSEKNALGKGAVSAANGQLICIAEDTGEVVLIKASPNGWDETGRFTLSPQTDKRKSDGRIWTHPVVANGRLFLRDQDLVYCYDIAET